MTLHIALVVTFAVYAFGAALVVYLAGL